VAQLGSGSGTDYPDQIDTRQTWVNVANAAPDSASRVDAELINDFAMAIVAIQNELGADPSGTFGSVAARLNAGTQTATAGSTAEATVTSVDGSATISAPGLVPPGARVNAVVVKVTQAFSTEHGLSGFHVGGMGLVDGWGADVAVALNTSTGGSNYKPRRGDQPVAWVPENIVLTAVGGEFGLSGAVFIRVIYEVYDVD
jgi:hypothetical protein